MIGKLHQRYDSSSLSFLLILEQVLGCLIGDSAQVLDKISRLTCKSLRNYLNISYVNLQLDLEGRIRDSDIEELKNPKHRIEDITVILHNMAFNRSISEADIDPEYNRHSYQVDWNIKRDNRFTCSQAYMVIYGINDSVFR
jgi:hypothetical protein